MGPKNVRQKCAICGKEFGSTVLVRGALIREPIAQLIRRDRPDWSDDSYIMMSQNRQEAKDRLRSQHDYQVNLKAELEIRQLHEKIDHLLSRQWDRLVQIQEIQIDLLSELRRQK
jgi:hypothetical protein